MSNKSARRNGNKRKQAEISVSTQSFEAFMAEWEENHPAESDA